MVNNRKPDRSKASQYFANRFLASSGKTFPHKVNGLLIRVDTAHTIRNPMIIATPPPVKKRIRDSSKKISGPFLLWIKPTVQIIINKLTMIVTSQANK